MLNISIAHAEVVRHTSTNYADDQIAGGGPLHPVDREMLKGIFDPIDQAYVSKSHALVTFLTLLLPGAGRGRARGCAPRPVGAGALP